MAHATQEPIYITKNGEGDLVVLSIQEYRKLERKLDLFAKLSVAQAQWDQGNRGRSYRDVMKDIRKRLDERKSKG